MCTCVVIRFSISIPSIILGLISIQFLQDYFYFLQYNPRTNITNIELQFSQGAKISSSLGKKRMFTCIGFFEESFGLDVFDVSLSRKMVASIWGAQVDDIGVYDYRVMGY